jgi:hypothetical protein
MIKLLENGNYLLAESPNLTKILELSDLGTFAWVSAEGIGEILVSSNKKNKPIHVLALNKYRLYEVKDEPDFTDLLHLELLVGRGVWQGYLLPTGMPNEKKKKSRIIPTEELITFSTV